jgi:hypothetical protein
MKSVLVFCGLLVATSAFYIDTKANATSSEELDEKEMLEIALLMMKYQTQIECIQTKFEERQEEIAVRISGFTHI